MSFDLEKILASKRALRRELAAKPIAQKLRMLDALRERALVIRPRRSASEEAVFHEEPPAYRTQEKKPE